MGTPQVLQNPDPIDVYKALFDALDDAYWEASDVQSKDLVHGVEMVVGDLIKQIGEQQLKDNAAIYAALGPKIKMTNDALKKVQAQIDDITKNIDTAAKVVSAIASALSMFPL